MKLLALVPLFAAGCFAMAETTEEQIEKFKGVVRDEIRHPDKKDPMGISHAMDLQTNLVQLANAADSEYPTQQVINALNQIEQLLASEKSRASCRAIVKRIREERELREKTIVEKMKKDYADTLRAAFQVKEIKELDPMIIKVNELVASAQKFPDGGAVKNMAFQGGRLSEILREWQDVLAQSGRGSFANLQNWINNNNDMGEWLPRSEILSRLTAAQAEMEPGRTTPASEKAVEEKARKIIAETHTLEEIKDCLEKLQALSISVRRSNSYLGNIISNLESLQRYYLESEKGVPQSSSVSIVTHIGGPNSEDLLALRSQVVLHILFRFLQIPDTEAPKPGEDTTAYLRRIKIGARDQADWELLNRALEIEQSALFSQANFSDRNALQLFLGGINLVRARQYALAVPAFQRALNTGSQLISAEMIGDRLDAIRKEHPQEYAEGMKVMLTPSATPEAGNAKTQPPAKN